MSRSASLPAPPDPNSSPNVGAAQQKQGGDLDEDYDYLSAYVNSGGPEDAGSLGPLRVANESGGDGRQAQGHGGYGNGRFTTDLEGLR
jgi:hypothetical protein